MTLDPTEGRPVAPADANDVRASTHDARGGGAPGPADDPRRWREVAAEGRFEPALRLRTIAIGEGAEADAPDDAEALSTLAAVQDMLRQKAWRKAERRMAELEARPTWIDVPAAAADAAALAEAGTALDARDVEATLAALGPMEARAGGPFEAERLTQLGTAKILDGDGDEARACFEAALALDPRHARALVNLGNVALEAGEVDAAIETYERALQIDDGFANAHHNLGVAYRRKGQIGKSVRSLRRAQKAERAVDARSAREEVRGMREKLGGGRALRWALWGVTAAVVVWLLVTRGA